MSRKEARIWTVKLLYQMEMNQEFLEKTVDSFLLYHNIQDDESEYIKKSAYSIINNIREIDGIIKKYLDKWKYERIAKVDLSILRLAINEITYFPDIPLSVSINEAVEIAKEYSTMESHKFINGILGSYAKSLSGEGSKT